MRNMPGGRGRATPEKKEKKDVLSSPQKINESELQKSLHHGGDGHDDGRLK